MNIQSVWGENGDDNSQWHHIFAHRKQHSYLLSRFSPFGCAIGDTNY